MGTKLTFKNEKKVTKNKKSKRKDKVLTSLAAEKLQEPSFYINGILTPISDIKINELTGWTTALPDDFKNLPSNGLPILITCQRDETLCLQLENNDATVKTSSSLDYYQKDQNILFSKEFFFSKLDTSEPKLSNQVFLLSDVTSMFVKPGKLLSTEVSKIYTLKASNGSFLMYNPELPNLTTTKTLSENTFFNLTVSENNSFKIGVNNKAKVIVSDQKRVIVVENDHDEEDLLADLNIFTIRTQIIHTATFKGIINALEFNDKPHLEDIQRDKLLELKKSGVKITDKLVKELQNAIKEGNTGEWMIETKEKYLADRRA